jgi:hypothetical protein
VGEKGERIWDEGLSLLITKRKTREESSQDLTKVNVYGMSSQRELERIFSTMKHSFSCSKRGFCLLFRACP